jgi:flagellar basal body-associated protein FliL
MPIEEMRQMTIKPRNRGSRVPTPLVVYIVIAVIAVVILMLVGISRHDATGDVVAAMAGVAFLGVLALIWVLYRALYRNK